MKIQPAQIDNTISTILNSEYRACLIYGPEESVIRDRLSRILEQFKKSGVDIVELKQDDFKTRPSILQEEFCAISMFSSRIAVVLKLNERENSYTKYLEDLFKNITPDNLNFLIITAGDLETSSSLRKYCDSNNAIASIACYEENDRNIIALINKKLKEYNFNYNKDVVDYLSNNIGSNVLIIAKEIEKINLYKGDDRSLTLNDVKNCVVDLASLDLNDFINEFCSFNRQEVFRLLNKIFQEGVSIITLNRMLVRYFLQLQRIQYSISSGENLEALLKKERVFWKQEPLIKDHIRRWSLNNINTMLEKLIEVEKNTKFSENGNVEFENFVLKSLLYFNR